MHYRDGKFQNYEGQYSLSAQNSQILADSPVKQPMEMQMELWQRLLVFLFLIRVSVIIQLCGELLTAAGMLQCHHTAVW
jgi:hypothetical protein